MGKFITFRCDAPNCTQLKKDSNHWFVFQQHEHLFQCMPLETNEHLLDAEDSFGSRIIVGTLCSHNCAQRVFEAFLYSLDKQQTQEPTEPNTKLVAHIDNADEPPQ